VRVGPARDPLFFITRGAGCHWPSGVAMKGKLRLS